MRLNSGPIQIVEDDIMINGDKQNEVTRGNEDSEGPIDFSLE